MTSLIAMASILAALAPTGANLPQTRPAPMPNGTIIVKILPGAVNTMEPNYIIDGQGNAQKIETPAKQSQSTPDSRLEEMKKVLNERFKSMFELKNELDKTQGEMSRKWEEYYSMNQAYNKELKKIIADWVTDNNYEGTTISK